MLWENLPAGVELTTEQKRETIRAYINRILFASDWTQLPDSGLSNEEKLAQQEIRAEWMAVDDADPDTVVFPQFPMMERL